MQVVRGVRVRQGDIAGLVKETEAGVKYLSFQGIPYAAPPVGDLRFKVRTGKARTNFPQIIYDLAGDTYFIFILFFGAFSGAERGQVMGTGRTEGLQGWPQLHASQGQQVQGKADLLDAHCAAKRLQTAG